MTEENNKNKKGRGREKGVSNINEKENQIKNHKKV